MIRRAPRADREKFLVVGSATINDERLSFRARGILLWLLEKPDNWTVRSEAIARAGREGRDAVRAALLELERCGYLRRVRERDATTGQYVCHSEVSETPIEKPPDAACAWKPDVGKPDVGKPGDLTNTKNEEEEKPLPGASLPGLEPPSSRKRERPKDLLFEAVCEATGTNYKRLTASGRGALNKAVYEIRQVCDTPGQVIVRAGAFRKRFPGMALTPSSLAKYWAQLEPKTDWMGNPV